VEQAKARRELHAVAQAKYEASLEAAKEKKWGTALKGEHRWPSKNLVGSRRQDWVAGDPDSYPNESYLLPALLDLETNEVLIGQRGDWPTPNFGRAVSGR
jgi:hypothetical protein